tara:strand:- start:436 stop:564 length:129 start_codon:yes stop_codon:yes gene_type:complete
LLTKLKLDEALGVGLALGLALWLLELLDVVGVVVVPLLKEQL